MEILFICLALIVIFVVAGSLKKKCENNIGYNIGKKHMKDWGIEENEIYHE